MHAIAIVRVCTAREFIAETRSEARLLSEADIVTYNRVSEDAALLVSRPSIVLR